jgi:hypothetical protein
MGKYADAVLSQVQAPAAAPKMKYANAVLAPVDDGRVGTQGMDLAPKPEAVGEDAGAGFLTSFLAALPEDTNTRINIYAKAMFPNEPDAARRFSVENGKVIYRDAQGKLQDAEAGVMSKLGQFAANAPEIIGGALGAAATTPTGPGIIVGGAGGATAGKGVKQIIAGALLDEPQTVAGNVEGQAKEFAANLAGGAVAKGATSLYNRSAVRGADKFDRPKVEGRIADVKAKTGIELDFTQAADQYELRALKRFAAEYPNEAADIVRMAREGQTEQIEQSISKRLLPTLAKDADRAFNANKGISAARAAIDAAKLDVRESVQKQYADAYRMTLMGDPGFTKDPVIRSALAAIKRDPVYQREIAGFPPNSLGLYDLAKRQIDDQIGAAQRAGENNRVRILTQAKESLVKELDAINPRYAEARSLFEQGMRTKVDPLEKGFVGVLAKIDSPKLAEVAAGVMDDILKNPNVTAGVRTALERKDPEAWGALVRVGLERKLNKALTENATGDVVNVAGRFRKAVFGTPDQKKAWAAALNADQRMLLDDIMDALETVSKDIPANSSTVPKSLVVQDVERSVEPLSAKLSRAKEALTLSGLGSRLTQERSGEFAKAIANALTQPETIAQLKQFRRLSPGTERATQVAGLVFGGLAAGQPAPESPPTN